MPSSVRIQRIADRIREELAGLLIREINDPRLRQIFITDARVDRELAFADVYVSAIEGQARSQEILQGLKSATGYLRHALAMRLELRVFPGLRFHWDPTPENADHIEQLLAQIRNEQEQPAGGRRTAGRAGRKAPAQKTGGPRKARATSTRKPQKKK